MAVILEKRNGGPYTKKEQEQRRSKVYSLHFEKGQSAVKIAKTINANRNTINEDVKTGILKLSMTLRITIFQECGH